MEQPDNKNTPLPETFNDPRPPKKHLSDAARTGVDKEVLKLDKGKKEIEKPKKRHFGRNFLIVVLIIILGLVITVAATGLYDIPFLSSALGANKPKDLGVEISDTHLATMKEKAPMKIEGDTVEYASGGEIFAGEIAVDTEFTANEVSSWLRRHQKPNPILENLQVRQYEGGIEISAMASQYIKAPIYAKVDVDYTKAGTIDLNFQKLKVGVFSVPEKYIGQVEDYLEETVNDLKTRVPGFSIETYELHDGYSTFKGTFPETVKPSSEGWADLLNY